MRIVFIGTVLFSEEILKKIIEIKLNIVGVVTKPKSNYNSDYVDLSMIAIEHQIPVLHTYDVNCKETEDWVASLDADYIFCIGWSQILKSNILKLPKKCVVGYHPSLLPNNKGRHPLIWAKVLGLKKTGSTFFIMDEGADTGKIISQKEFNITFEDDATSLYNKMIINGRNQIDMIAKHLDDLFSISQNQVGDGNSWRKRSFTDGEINFRMNTNTICNLVRAITHPYFGAHFIHNGIEIKVWKVEPYDFNTENDEPGKVLKIIDNDVVVKTAGSAIKLIGVKADINFVVNEYIL